MKTKWILTAALVCIVASAAGATPITYVSATVPTSFSPNGGDYGLGTLELLEEDAAIVIEYNDGTEQVEEHSDFFLGTNLQSDNSAGGIASGLFAGGTFMLADEPGNTLLSGNVVNLDISESFNDIGVLAGSGRVKANAGLLLPEFGYPTGAVYQIAFQVKPRAMDDFSQGFSGHSSVSFAPIVPEPATIALLSLGLGGLLAYRRR